MSLYDAGADRFRNIATIDARWLLVQSTFVFSAAHLTLSGMSLGTHEINVSGYTRVALTTPVRSVDTSVHQIGYTADNPNFGTLVAGQNVTGIVLYEHITNDASSVPMGYYPLASKATNAFNPFVVYFPSGILALLAEAP